MLVFYEIVEIIGCLLSYLFILFTTNIFCNYKSKKLQALSLLLSIVYIPLTYDLIIPISNTLASLLAMVFVLAVMLFCFNGKAVIKIFIVLIYNIFSVCFSNLYFSLFSFLFNISINELVSERTALRAALIISLYIFEIIILVIIERLVNSTIENQYTVLELSITLLFLIIDFVFAVFSFAILSYRSDEIVLIQIVCCSMSILCLVCAFVALYLIKKLKARYIYSLENLAMKMQLNEMDMYVKSAQKNTSEIRSLRHDMKNKLLAYHSLLSKNDTADVIQDIKNTLALPSLSEPLTYCSNVAFNSLIFNKAQLASESNITFNCRACIEPEYSNLQLMVAFSSLIDNAIEHELTEPSEVRNIKLSIIQTPEDTNIIIENYISHSVLKDNPVLSTTKENPFSHGFGISNARQLVTSIDGIIDFYEEDNSFFAHIIL